MKKIILLFFALFFLGCKTINTSIKTSDESTQVSAGKISIEVEKLAKEILDISNEIKSIQKVIPDLESDIDGMKIEYDKKVAECEMWKQKYEKLYACTKQLLRNILDENPDAKKDLKKYNPEVYRLIYNDEEIK